MCQHIPKNHLYPTSDNRVVQYTQCEKCGKVIWVEDTELEQEIKKKVNHKNSYLSYSF
jgi:Fe2+ or Zn2+ uptake regulation protein